MTRSEATYVTVAYADIFSFALTSDELHEWLVAVPSKKKFVPVHPLVTQRNGYVTLKGREHLFRRRIVVRGASEEKWLIVHSVIPYLKWIPSIRLIGVTGGLAMNNAAPEDDIDLFFVTERGTVWISRLLATLVVGLLGRRRRPLSARVANLLCLNMFLSVSQQRLPAGEHDLYTAHEVLQMRPVWWKDDAYGRFLHDNAWVRAFLPNAWTTRMNDLRRGDGRITLLSTVAIVACRMAEPLMRAMQMTYMKRRKTTETVTQSVIRFHPRDVRGYVRKQLRRRLKMDKMPRNIPLDKHFWAR